MAGLTYVTGTAYLPAEFIVRPLLSALGSTNEPDPSNPMDTNLQNPPAKLPRVPINLVPFYFPSVFLL